MPIFEYVCRACGRRFELLQLPRSQEPEAACPECEGTEVERVISAPAVSSDATRERSLSAAKQKRAAVRQEKAAAESHAERHQHDDH